jgi:hypothetical protein
MVRHEFVEKVHMYKMAGILHSDKSEYQEKGGIETKQEKLHSGAHEAGFGPR